MFDGLPPIPSKFSTASCAATLMWVIWARNTYFLPLSRRAAQVIAPLAARTAWPPVASRPDQPKPERPDPQGFGAGGCSGGVLGAPMEPKPQKAQKYTAAEPKVPA